MHKKRPYNKSSYYATILFAISFVLLAYGFILDFHNEHKLIDPIKDVVETGNEESVINVETVDKNDITTEEAEDSKDKTATTTKTPTSDTTKNGNKSNSSNGNNNTKSNNGSKSNSSNQGTIKSKTTPSSNNQNSVSTIDEVNNRLRKNIENTYNITVKYGSETAGYSIAGCSTEPITNPTTINSQLVRLNNALSLYPEGIFREIKNGGIPLTILLINKYSDEEITGITDSSYSYANISIAASHPFEDSFYHESYHYLERYLFKKGANFTSWDSLNPPEFAGWGVINGNLSYANTFSPSAPFVNNYAQTDAAEDRASTFEYMMASSKASCLNRGNTVWRKAKLMADTLDLVLSTVTPNTTEYWERYL